MLALTSPRPAFSQMAQGSRPKRAIRIGDGEARFDEHIKLGGVTPLDCKLSAKDTGDDLCIFVDEGQMGKGGPPLHIHHYQDEWWYILEGQFEYQIGDERFHVKSGDSVFAPRGIPHTYAHVGEGRGKQITLFQPAGKMEAFFREIGKLTTMPPQDEFQKLFRAHGMEVVGPRLSI